MQVSRRLNRRLKQALYDKQLGYVKIAVTTYTFLLKQSTAEDSRYSHSYFAKELVCQPDAVVSGLACAPRINSFGTRISSTRQHLLRRASSYSTAAGKAAAEPGVACLRCCCCR